MQIKDVIVCDDIRTEVANKFSLIGIYFDKINIESRGNAIKLPLMIKLGLLIRLHIGDSDEFPQEFKIRYHINNEDIIVLGGDVRIDPGTGRTLAIPIVTNVPITKIGTLNFDIEFSKNGTVTYFFKDIHPIQILEKQPDNQIPLMA